MGFTVLFYLLVLALAIKALVMARGSRNQIRGFEEKLLQLRDELRAFQKSLDTLKQAARPTLPIVEQTGTNGQIKPAAAIEPLEPASAKIKAEVPQPEKGEVRVAATGPGIIIQQPEQRAKSDNRLLETEGRRTNRQKPLPPFWEKIERGFMENWLGILGSVLLVAGLGILGVYAALKFRPFYRFVLLSGMACFLVILYFVLGTKQVWKPLASWIRSSAGAVFLFACLGSGGIPGLQWIFNPLAGLILLSTGIAVNLFLSYLGGKQTFASLHVLLSLISISIAPQQAATLIIAVIITVFSILLTLREKWEYHLALTIFVFFSYLVFWRFTQPEIILSLRYLGVVSTFTVFLTAATVHYRRIYSKHFFEVKSFLVHLFNWCFLGVGLYLYSPRFHWISLAVALAALGIFFLARRAKKLAIRWLYLTDTLTAEITAFLALILLSRWDWHPFYIVAVMFFETQIFSLIMLLEREKTLYKLGVVLQGILSTALVFAAILLPVPYGSVSFVLRTMVINTAAITASAWGYFVLIKHPSLYPKALPLHPPTLSYRFYLTGGVVSSLFLGFSVSGLLTHNSAALYPLTAEFILLLSTIVFLSIKAPLEKRSSYIAEIIYTRIIIYLVILLLYRWGFRDIQIISLLAIETMGFSLVQNYRKDARLNTLALTLLNGWSILLACLILADSVRGGAIALMNNVKLILGIAGIYSGFAVVSTIKKIEPENGQNVRSDYKQFAQLMPEILTFLIGLFIIISYFLLHKAGWTWPFGPANSLLAHSAPLYALTIPALILLYLRNRLRFNGLGIALVLFLLLVHIMSWSALYTNPGESVFIKTAATLPLLILSLFSVKFSYLKKTARPIKWFGIYLLTIHIGFMSYFLFNPISPWIPGVSWLLLSLVLLELARFLRKTAGESLLGKGRSDFHLIVSGYALMVAFLIRYVLVNLRMEQNFGLFKVRMLIALLALVIFSYWFMFKQPNLTRSYKTVALIQPLFLELIIGFSAFTLLVEMDSRYIPFIWISGAILFLLIKNIGKKNFSRLQLYSVLLFWSSAFHLSLISSPYVQKPFRAFEALWLLAVLTIFLQLVYIVLFYQRYKANEVQMPYVMKKLEGLIRKFDRTKNLWIFYPSFISITLFLNWSFDKSLLTLLLCLEVFSIFIISIILKENHFRHLWTLAMAGCLVRLITYDLAKAHTLTKALVFIGVAVIMLVMNGIYNRYKARFKKSKNF